MILERGKEDEKMGTAIAVINKFSSAKGLIGCPVSYSNRLRGRGGRLSGRGEFSRK